MVTEGKEVYGRKGGQAAGEIKKKNSGIERETRRVNIPLQERVVGG
jgi:hypothetical protein